MKVSVIMAVYNGEQYLKESIDSILSQTFEDFELLIVNDGSTDRTKDILKEYDDPRIRIFPQSNKGCIAARHLAIKNARGKYLAIMDADDIALPERLSKTVAHLDSHSDVVLVGTGFIVSDDFTELEQTVIPPADDCILRRCLLRYDPLKDPTNLIRAKAFKKAGGYKVDHGFDYELYSRLAKVGKLANISDVLLITRQHADQFFRMGHSPEAHRKRRLKIRWLTLCRLKPSFSLFAQTFIWLCFEYVVHLFPEKLRNILPKNFRNFFKKIYLLQQFQYIMLKITSIAGNIFENKELEKKYHSLNDRSLCESLKFSRHELEKKRIRKNTDKGSDVGLIFDDDSKLSHGDVLIIDEKFILVEQLPEKVLLISQKSIAKNKD